MDRRNYLSSNRAQKNSWKENQLIENTKLPLTHEAHQREIGGAGKVLSTSGCNPVLFPRQLLPARGNTDAPWV